MAGGDETSGPSLFISHRHADHAIAGVLRDWIRDCTMETVRVYQSSNATDAVPSGSRLTAALRQQLHASSVVLCIFTGHDADWSWCMWECGVATDPLEDSTRVVVLQFCDDFPRPYADVVRVDVRNDRDVERFATELLTSPDFVPGHGRPLRQLDAHDPVVERKAQELVNALRDVGPPAPVEVWESWSVLNLEFPIELVDGLDDAQPEPDRVAAIQEMLLMHCHVVEGQRLARNMFGIIRFPERIAFSKLYSEWQRQVPHSTSQWLESLAKQISLTARRRLPATDWEIVEGATTQLSIPVLCWTVRDPAKRTFQFHMYFIPVKTAGDGGLELGFTSPGA